MKILKPNKVPISLYVHFPWCEKQCPYCDFNIEVKRSAGDEEDLLKAIINDLNLSKEYISNRKFKSVYFGGGTPSLIPIEVIKKIIHNLYQNKLLEKDCEISFELNPKEVRKDYLDDLVSIGINRISIGIQSFNSNTLAALERNHDEIDALKAIKLASETKSINTTIDLIYGVMGQELESFKSDIETFCSFDIDHLSLYQLTIEPNTIFYKKELVLPADSLIESMEMAAKDLLNKNNLYQYEVSSWSKKNKESQHNMNYWLYGDYLGVGPGAHSKITTIDSITRMIKLKKVSSYIKDPAKTIDSKITPDSYDLDLAMNLLRLKEGVSLKDLEKKYIYISDTFLDKYENGIKEKLLEKDGVKATSKGYKFLNDTINLFS
ncbi:MAG: radical SAM family heme chaperone HemW [Gammaproteobacteria bacterium]